MEKISKVITLAGISNANTPDVCNDGECCDMVNLHNMNGAWSVYGAPKKVIECDNAGRLCKYIHCNSDYSNVISYDGKSVFWEGYMSGNHFYKKGEVVANIDGVVSFESMGNILIMGCNNGYQYALFKDNSYLHIGQLDTPVLRFKLDKKFELAKRLNFIPLPNQTNVLSFENFSFIADRTFTECFCGIEEEFKETNSFYSPFLVRYALRLFDGSYIRPSAPVLMMTQDSITRNRKNRVVINENSSSSYFYNIEILYDLYHLMFDTAYIPSNVWDDIISSVDIFISKPLFGAKDDKDEVKFSLVESVWNEASSTTSHFVDVEFPYKSDEEIKEFFADETQFYKVASFKLSELREEHKYPECNYRRISPDFGWGELTAQDILPVDNFSHYNLTGESSFIYNSRLHIANIRRFLPQPMPLLNFCTEQSIFNGFDTETDMSISGTSHIRVTIPTVNGNKYVECNCLLPARDSLMPYIAYPDCRASLMEIWVEKDDGTKGYAALPLTASKMENLSYYINDNYKGISLRDFSGDIPSQEQQDYEIFPNLMRVSQLENPLFFPQELSYTISNGNILKIAAVTTELSQGRYGDFPLYVFASDGIWALQQGNGDVIYSSLLPVSRDIALSEKSIVNIDKAVIFLSERGLLALNGSVVTPLWLFGLNRNDIIESRVVEGSGFNVVSDQSVVEGFADFIKNSYVEFDYNNNELLFLKSGEKFLYSFSLSSKCWTRFKFGDDSCSSFLKLYPKLFIASDEGNLYSISDEQKESSMPFFFVTRAIKGIPLAFKHIKEALLKWELDFVNEKLNIEILGSNFPDRDFKTISKAVTKKSYSDGIRVPVYAPPYKYFRVAVWGNGKCGMCINSLILLFMPKYGARLR